MTPPRPPLPDDLATTRIHPRVARRTQPAPEPPTQPLPAARAPAYDPVAAMPTMPLPAFPGPRMAEAAAQAGSGERAALIEKSIRGTQWIMIAILIGVPLGFLTKVILSRLLGAQGPEALGILQLMTLLVTTVQTFFLFGGANVVVNFIPRAAARDKSAFIVSYLGIAAAFAVVFFAAVLIWPQILAFVLLQKSSGPAVVSEQTILLFLLLFIPIVIIQTLTIAVLQGEMELAAAARTQYGVQTATFALTLGAVYAIRANLLPLPLAVAATVLGAYALSLLSAAPALIRVVRRWRLSVRWHLPARFWRFTATVHVLTIAGFFFNGVDQIFILYYFGSAASVGLYAAPLTVATYALWAPNLFTGAMYPFFINLVARRDFATLRGAYQRYTAITGVIVAFFGLVSGLFAPQILTLFGSKQYSTTSLPLMQVFALMFTLLASCAYVPTAALITAHEDIWINLLMNVLALAVRVGLYIPLAARDGLLGVAISNAVSLAVLNLGTLAFSAARYHISIPARQHVVSLLGGAILLASFAAAAVLSPRLLLAERVLALAVFTLVVARLGLVSRADLARVGNRLPFVRRFLA